MHYWLISRSCSCKGMFYLFAAYFPTGMICLNSLVKNWSQPAKGKPRCGKLSKVQCHTACSVCVSHSNAQHQSRGESCWQRPPFINISSSHHFHSLFFLLWETSSLFPLLPSSPKKYVSHQCLTKSHLPFGAHCSSHHLLVSKTVKKLWSLILPLFTGQSIRRSQSVPSARPCHILQQESHTAQTPPCWQQVHSSSTDHSLAKAIQS